MKSKDFFKKLKSDGKINQAEFDSMLESVPDFDISDKAVEAFESSFMTAERALTHPDVNSKLRAELLDPVDRDIAKLLEHDLKDYIPHEDASRLKGEKSTYKKVGALGPALVEAIKKLKAAPTTDEDTKKKLKTLEETNQDLLGKIESINKEYSTKEETIKTEWQKKFHDYQLDGELEKMSNSFIFAEGFEEKRPSITKVTLADLKSQHSLSLGEKDGQIAINVLDKEGKPKFNGNSPVTINQMLEEAYKPFIKKNNSDDKDKGQNRETRTTVDQTNQNQSRQGVRTTVR
jgi:hypothetical protein